MQAQKRERSSTEAYLSAARCVPARRSQKAGCAKWRRRRGDHTNAPATRFATPRYVTEMMSQTSRETPAQTSAAPPGFCRQAAPW